MRKLSDEEIEQVYRLIMQERGRRGGRARSERKRESSTKNAKKATAVRLKRTASL